VRVDGCWPTRHASPDGLSCFEAEEVGLEVGFHGGFSLSAPLSDFNGNDVFSYVEADDNTYIYSKNRITIGEGKFFLRF
jgi:hypothetical protein